MHEQYTHEWGSMRWVFSIPRGFLAITIAAVVFIAGLTLWFSHKEYESFKDNHQRIFLNEAKSARTAIESFLNDRARLIETFTIENNDLIHSFSLDPENEIIDKQLKERLTLWFPGHFTFTLADHQGKDLIADIEGFVGDVCVASIKTFLKTNWDTSDSEAAGHYNEPEIHPQPGNYHFDMMSLWKRDGSTKGVFFISFYPDVIKNLLKSYEGEGHNLVLINKDKENLIEVTSEGSRDVIGVSRDIRLTEWEIDNIAVRLPVSGSRWELVAYPDKGLFRKFEQGQQLSSSLIIIVTVIFASFGLYAASKLEEHRKTAQDELLEARDSLQIKVAELEDNRERLEAQAEALVEIAEEKAGLSDRLAQEVAIKNRFFSIVSHDLKSPFTSLLGMTTLMHNMSDKFTEEQFKEYAKNINDTGNKVFELLENLLEWARFQMEKSQLEPTQVSLKDVTAKCMDIFSQAAQSKGVQLEDNCPDLSVYADKEMVFLVLRNLIANAIKFTNFEGRVDISAVEIEQEGMVDISVSDTGIGMSKDYADKVFAVDEKTTTLGTEGEKGTGLGLPLCKEMVEANSGKIWIDSTEGSGTTFHVVLPVAR